MTAVLPRRFRRASAPLAGFAPRGQFPVTCTAAARPVTAPLASASPDAAPAAGGAVVVDRRIQRRGHRARRPERRQEPISQLLPSSQQLARPSWVGHAGESRRAGISSPPEAVRVLRAQRSIRYRSWKKELRSDVLEFADRQRSVRSESSALGRSDCSHLVSYYCSAVSGSVLLHELPSWSGPLVVSLVRFLIRLPLVRPRSPRHHSQRLSGTRQASLRCEVRTLGRPSRPWTGWRSSTTSGRAWSLPLDRRLLHTSRAAGHFRFEQFRLRSLGFLKRLHLLWDKKPKTAKRTRRRIAAMDTKGGSPPQRAWRGHSPIHSRRYQHESKSV